MLNLFVLALVSAIAAWFGQSLRFQLMLLGGSIFSAVGGFASACRDGYFRGDSGRQVASICMLIAIVVAIGIASVHSFMWATVSLFVFWPNMYGLGQKVGLAIGDGSLNRSESWQDAAQQLLPEPSTTRPDTNATLPDEERSTNVTAKITAALVLGGVVSYFLVRLDSPAPAPDDVKERKSTPHVPSPVVWVPPSGPSVIQQKGPRLPPEQEPPRTGAGDFFTDETREPRRARLKIFAGLGSNYFVKVKRPNTRERILEVFIRSGEQTTVFVPLGTFQLEYTAGDKWYGFRDCFGHLLGTGAACMKADKMFTFTQTADAIQGYNVTLYPVRNGNLSTSHIDPHNF